MLTREAPLRAQAAHEAALKRKVAELKVALEKATTAGYQRSRERTHQPNVLNVGRDALRDKQSSRRQGRESAGSRRQDGAGEPDMAWFEPSKPYLATPHASEIDSRSGSFDTGGR